MATMHILHGEVPITNMLGVLLLVSLMSFPSVFAVENHPGWPVNVGDYSTSSPSIADLDGNSSNGLEIIIAVNGLSTCGHGTDSRIDAYYQNNTTMWSRGLCYEKFRAPPTIGDIDNDGDLEVVAGSKSGAVYVLYYNNGSNFPGWPISVGATIYSSQAVGDLDNNNNSNGLEVIVSAYDGRLYTFYSNGTPFWNATAGGPIMSSPVLGDIDDDGYLEIVVGSDDGKVYAWNHNGTNVTGWPQTTNKRVQSSPALGDIDSDGSLEVIVGSQDSKVYAWHYDGNPVSGWPRSTGDETQSSPALGDIDDDGYLEVVVASEDYKVYAWHYDGTDVDGWPTASLGGNFGTYSSPTLADINGDNKTDIIIGLKNGNVSTWNSSGSVIWSNYTGSQDPVSTAALGDIDNNGEIEVVVGSWGGIINVWDTNVSYNPNYSDWPMFHHDTRHTGLYVDMRPPLTTLLSPSNGSWVNGNVTLVMSVVDPGASGVKKVQFQYCNITSCTWKGISNATGEPYLATWNTSNLTDGSEWHIRAVPTDRANNTNWSVTNYTFTVDHGIPSIGGQNVTYPPGQSAARINQNITLRVNVTDYNGSGIRNVTVDASSIGGLPELNMTNISANLPNETSTWEANVTVNISYSGAELLTITAYDNATTPNEATGAVFIVKVDNIPPTGAIFINNDAACTNNVSVTLLLSAVSDANNVSNMTFSNDSSNWSNQTVYSTNKSWNLTSGEGNKTVYANFSDTIGNWMTTPLNDTITLDTILPNITVISPGNNTVYRSSSVVLNVSSDETVAWSYTLDGGDEVEFTSPNTTGDLSNGQHKVTVYASDCAGNINSTTTWFTVNVRPPPSSGGGSITTSSCINRGVQPLTSELMECMVRIANLRYKQFYEADKALASILALTGATTGEYPAPSDPDVQGFLAKPVRASGGDVYELASYYALRRYTRADTLIIARGDIPVDSMAAIAYAKSENIPILLTKPEELPSATLDAISRLDPEKIIVVGGPVAVSQSVENNLSEISKVERIWGRNREETAVELAKAVRAGTIIVANGEDPSTDAVLISALYKAPAFYDYKAPIVYVKESEIPQVTKEYLLEHKTTVYERSMKVVVIGVNDTITAEIENLMRR